MQIFQVGGSVRDKLLNIPSHDVDYVVVGATADQLLKLGFVQVGNDFPVFLHPQTKDEYALARTEFKNGHGHTGFSCEFNSDISLEEDLFRRDLTINAIAMDSFGNLIDPFGGMSDIKNRKLRHISNSFSDDPLRVLRVARFMAKFSHLGFSVATETLEIMEDVAKSGELSHLTPERLWKELSRALCENTPSQFFLTLRAANCLQAVFPEIDQLFGVAQNAEHHPEIDAGIHTMMVVDRARELSNDLTVITAALLHDLGKGITPEHLWPKHLNHETSGLPLVDNFCNRLKVPSSVHLMSLKVCEHHLRCHRSLEMRPGRVLNLIETLDGIRNPSRVVQFTLACMADAQGRLGMTNKKYPQREFLKDALEACRNIDTKPILAKGLKGADLGSAIRNERLIQIAKLCSKIEPELNTKLCM